MIETELAPGHRLGPYELVVPVAQGGMATVWAARLKGMRNFSKEVAIKAMLPTLGDDPQFEEMFLTEAKLACRIRHPNVAEVMDLGEQDGTLYIVMEWVDGEPLSIVQRVASRKGGVPLALAARIGAAAGWGLHAAHELTNDQGQLLGLVHRDVSPQNILITYSGQVKIVDFGVAKAAAQASEGPKTRVGETKGTLTFMSPEQAVGGRVDRRSDVFALGIVMYYLVGGKHPFKGENEFQTLGAITNRIPVPPLIEVNPKCPPLLNAAIMKALQKPPDQRHETMALFAAALEQAATEAANLSPAPQLATFMQQMLGDRGERRSAAIREATSLLDGNQPVPRDLGQGRGSIASHPAFDPRGSQAEIEGAMSVAPPPNPLNTPAAGVVSPSMVPAGVPAPGNNLKMGILVAVTVLFLAAAFIVGWVLTEPSVAPPAPSSTSGSEVPTATAAPSPSTAAPTKTAAPTAAPTQSAKATASAHPVTAPVAPPPTTPPPSGTGVQQLTNPGF